MLDDLPRTPQQRLEDALNDWAAVNRGIMPNGVDGFNLPDTMDQGSRLDALTRLLIEKGVFTEQEFNDARVLRCAEIVEESVAQVREIKRTHSGLVLAGTRPS